MKTKLEQAQTLVDDLVVMAEKDDENKKAELMARGRGRETIGESTFVFHLRVLKKLLGEMENG